MDFTPNFENIFKSIKRAFLGNRIFGGDNRELFRDEILNTSRIRTHFALYLILIIQIVNYIYNLTLAQHSQCLDLIGYGTASYTLVCFVYAILFSYFERKEANLSVRNLLVKSYWALILLCSLWFTYSNFVEEKSAAFNITIIVLAIAIVPTLTLTEILSYLLPYVLVNIAFGLYLNVPPYFIQQLIILAVISIYVSQSQYFSAVKVFTERQHLSDTNVRLEKLAETDSLTGLLNRRGLDNHLCEFENYYRFLGEYICVLIISVDNFRGRNVLRKTGDDCLVGISECIKACAYQSTDAIARLGGEEFLIISDIKNEGAISLALRIKRAVEDQEIKLADNLPCLTVSIGAAVHNKEDILLENRNPVPELIKISDVQLANAKSCGRNCVSSGDIIFR